MIKPFNPDRWELDLAEKRILYLSGEINANHAEKFGIGVVWLNAQDKESPITLYIDSPGGSVPAGLDIYDMIRHSSAPFTGIVYRRANSIAGVILQACATRQALPNAEILIHCTRLRDVPIDDIDAFVREARKGQEIINTIYHERAGITQRALKKLNREHNPISATDAFSLGLIDEILWPQ